MNIAHIIIGLGTGGAELMLKRLIQVHSDDLNYNHIVISLTNLGKVGIQLKSIGVEVHALEMRTIFDIPFVLWQLIRLIRTKTPQIIQTWMYHADLIGGIAGWVTRHDKILWGIRGTDIPQKGFSFTRIIVFLCAIASYFVPHKIVCNSEAAMISHIKKMYDKKKMVVIPNGYDLDQYTIIPELQQKARTAFGFTSEEIIVGIIGRFDPLKDYKNFVNAATEILTDYKNIKFLMVGQGIDTENKILMGWLSESNRAKEFVLAGFRSDIPFCLSAMDIFCLSSRKESFPNVVCEAMAMSLPCVATNVGDISSIIGNTGVVVTPEDYKLLSKGLSSMIDKGAEERTRLGKQARERILTNYSIQTISARYEKLWSDMGD